MKNVYINPDLSVKEDSAEKFEKSAGKRKAEWPGSLT